MSTKKLKITGTLNDDKVTDDESLRDFIKRNIEENGKRHIAEDYKSSVSVQCEYTILTYGYDIVGSVSVEAVYSHAKGANITKLTRSENN